MAGTVNDTHERLLEVKDYSKDTLDELEHVLDKVGTWLPDGYSQIFRSYVFWPFGLLDYGSATLRCKI